MSLKEQTLAQLRTVKGQSQQLYKQPYIKFVRAGDLEGTTGREGNDISSLYQSIVNIKYDNDEEHVCRDCGIVIRDYEKHQYSTIHQVASAPRPTEQPLRKLVFTEESIAYKYLSKYGWSPHHRHGLGAAGRKGSRDPVKSTIKLDKSGIGWTEKNQYRISKSARAPPKLLNAKEAKAHHDKERDQRARILYQLRN